MTEVKKHVEGEADHYIKTLIGAVLGYAADGLDMFLLSFILIFIIQDFGLTTAEAGQPHFSDDYRHVDRFVYFRTFSRQIRTDENAVIFDNSVCRSHIRYVFCK